MGTPPLRPIDRHWRSTPILKPEIKLRMPDDLKAPAEAFVASRDLVAAIDHIGRAAPPECCAGEIAAAALLSHPALETHRSTTTHTRGFLSRVDRICAFLAATGNTSHPFYTSLISPRARSFSSDLSEAAVRWWDATGSVPSVFGDSEQAEASLKRLSSAMLLDADGDPTAVMPDLAPHGVDLSADEALSSVYWTDNAIGGATMRALGPGLSVRCVLNGDVSPREAGCSSALALVENGLVFLRKGLVDGWPEEAVFECFAALNATHYLDVLLPIVSPQWELHLAPTPPRRPRIRL